MQGNFADIHCPNCGSPAKYDILQGRYGCRHCGGKVEVDEAIAQKQGFRSIRQSFLRKNVANYQLMKANCNGCGAEIVFEKNEALSSCAFCGRSLVKKEYFTSEEMPEPVIPFRITAAEAAERLEEWCQANGRKKEAQILRKYKANLQSCYLPYELVRGPVCCKVSRKDSVRHYECRGYVDKLFVNCSRQLDNLLLDSVEPYELAELKEFDFSYIAGQRVKIRDIDAQGLESRVREEVGNDYAPVVRKTLHTEAIDVATDASSLLRMPLLLPVYSITVPEIQAAVNGQTGKVAVRSLKASYYYFIPWWLKALLSTCLITSVVFSAFRLFGWSTFESLYFSSILAFFNIIVSLAAFSDTVQNSFRVEALRKVLVSSGGAYRRADSGLKQDTQPLQKALAAPVFLEKIEGKMQAVQLKFMTLPRLLKTVLWTLTALFLPVIIALFLNGFDFARLELGGSAVWFCIMIPVVPIYILKFEKIELYERPWIYLLCANGKKKRWREKHTPKVTKKDIGTFLKVLFMTSLGLAIWFGIACFAAMCYLTAFGFGE